MTLGNGVKTELTTTTRGGIGRFTFPATSQANLLFKLTGSQNGDYADSWQAVSDTEVAGSVTSGHFCGASNTYTLHFSVVFDRPFTTGTWLTSAVTPGARTASARSTARTTRKAAAKNAAGAAGQADAARHPAAQAKALGDPERRRT